MSFKTKKKIKKFLLPVSLIFLGCFLVGDFVLAESPLDLFTEGMSFTGEVILKGVNLVLYAILKLTFLLLAGSMWLLNVMISPEIFGAVFFSDVARNGINTAWSFVRDFFNLFFILIIVLIGLSTILGVGKFKDKTMLVRVAFAAMLINFSKPITLFVIDASQIFMNFFAKSIEDMNYSAQIQNLINFQKIVKFSDLGDDFVYFVAIVAIIIMTLIMAVMLFYLAISLIVRMIAFWVLIILSPMAMFGIAMEGTKLGSLKDDWLENLTKWSFYGPILLFFIWLSVILIAAISGATEEAMTGFSKLSSSQLDTNAGGLSKFIVALCGMLIPYITAIYLLFYGYDRAMKNSTGMAATILASGNKKINEWGEKAKNVYRVPIKNTKEMISEGAKARMEQFEDQGSWVAKRFTKGGKEDLRARRLAKAKKFLGGDKGEAERSYHQEKAQEALKKWKDNPPSGNELKTAFEGKDEVKKIAATLYKSQNNQLGINDSGVNEYEKAVENLKGHSGLQEKIERETKKENLGAVIKYDIKKEMEKNGGNENEARSKVLDSRVKGNFMDVVKNQNKNFYEQDGVVGYLYEKNKMKDLQTRKKWGESVKNTEVEEYLIKSVEGRFLLGQ